MGTKLSSKAVGSSVYLNVNGYRKKFLIAHQGKPSALYDASCNGTWLFMSDSFGKYAWGSDCSPSMMPLYNLSDVDLAVNVSFVNLLDADIKSQLKEAKIPVYSEGSVSCGQAYKAFIPSAIEMGLQDETGVGDGAKLDLFNPETMNTLGLAGCLSWFDDTNLRTPNGTDNSHLYATVSGSEPGYNISAPETPHNVHPMIILPGNLSVSGSGDIATNTAPTVTSTLGTSGANLGTKTAGFSFPYTVSDEDGDSLTITEKLDGAVKRTFTASSGATHTFEAVTAAGFMTVLNGTHTLSVEASDGSDTTIFSVTFTKAVHSASITLSSPLTVSGDITAAVLSVTGSIPADAVYTVEVTNNANDASPVWQNVTEDVKNGHNIVFTNSVCTSGAAFNFSINVSRGTSGAGGYFNAVTGAFK